MDAKHGKIDPIKIVCDLCGNTSPLTSFGAVTSQNRSLVTPQTTQGNNSGPCNTRGTPYFFPFFRNETVLRSRDPNLIDSLIASKHRSNPKDSFRGWGRAAPCILKAGLEHAAPKKTVGSGPWAWGLGGSIWEQGSRSIAGNWLMASSLDRFACSLITMRLT
jgi:hypothetical protein